MDGFQWYRWRPGAIPQLERVPLQERGLAHALMDHLWLNPGEVRGWQAVCDDLLLSYDQSGNSPLNRIYPVLRQYIQDERVNADTFRDNRRSAGRAGGLAKARSARNSVAELSSASASVAETDRQTERQKERTPPTPPRGKKPETMMGFGEGVKAVINALHPEWPRVQADGKPIRIDLSMWAERVDRVLQPANAHVTPDLLIAAARKYLASEKLNFKAPQYFFGEEAAQGPNGAHWRPYARMVWHETHKQEVTA